MSRVSESASEATPPPLAAELSSLELVHVDPSSALMSVMAAVTDMLPLVPLCNDASDLKVEWNHARVNYLPRHSL